MFTRAPVENVIMDINNPPKYVECHIDNQLSIFEDVRKLRSFIFRGHRSSGWDLSSSFEREFNKYPRSQMREGAEHHSIDFFKKRFHLYDHGIEKIASFQISFALCSIMAAQPG
jgi:hypothetical protein